MVFVGSPPQDLRRFTRTHGENKVREFVLVWGFCENESEVSGAMAEALEEAMEEGPADPRRPLQQDLTCSVCRGLFRDPLVLPCTHSFCRECLQKSTRFSGEQCPLCREKFTAGQEIPNRALSQVCQTFARYPPPGSLEGPGSEAGCDVHLKPLLLYCEKDEQPLCVDCVAQHNTHKLWPLTEAVPICKVTPPPGDPGAPLRRLARSASPRKTTKSRNIEQQIY